MRLLVNRWNKPKKTCANFNVYGLSKRGRFYGICCRSREGYYKRLHFSISCIILHSLCSEPKRSWPRAIIIMALTRTAECHVLSRQQTHKWKAKYTDQVFASCQRMSSVWLLFWSHGNKLRGWWKWWRSNFHPSNCRKVTNKCTVIVYLFLKFIYLFVYLFIYQPSRDAHTTT